MKSTCLSACYLLALAPFKNVNIRASPFKNVNIRASHWKEANMLKLPTFFNRYCFGMSYAYGRIILTLLVLIFFPN